MTAYLDERIEEFHAFERALSAQKGHESELAQVLITASYLDNQLKNIISAIFVADRPIKRLLEGPTAPMATFSNRTEFAYALGLIEDVEYRSINAIRHIRNRFAHTLSAKFDEEKLTKEFDKLAWVVGSDEVGDIDRSELLFIVSIRLGIGFTNRSDRVAAERRTAKDWERHGIDVDLTLDPLDHIY